MKKKRTRRKTKEEGESLGEEGILGEEMILDASKVDLSKLDSSISLL